MAAQATPDLSEFLGLSKPRKPPCRVGAARVHLVGPELAAFDAACATDKGTITMGAIRDWLKARGHDASVSAITNHRAGTCNCDG